MRLTRHPILKPLLCLATAVALLGGAHARDAAVADPAVAPPVPLLWKVSDDDNAVYLLGSFHLLKPDDYPLSRDVDLAFIDAEELLFEIPPEEMASPQLGAQMAQAAMRADGTTLDSELSPETRAKLADWAAANAAGLGMTPDVLQRFEPWFVALMITVSELTRLGLDPRLGLDAHFAAAAGKARKPTAGLETGAEQIAFLDGMTGEEQRQMLEEALGQSDEARQEAKRLHDAWRAGDAGRMWKEMALEMRAKYPQLYRAINVERNDAWLPKIERRLAYDGSIDTMVVVGALHLLGEDGLVEKLRARGYQVERICSACAE